MNPLQVIRKPLVSEHLYHDILDSDFENTFWLPTEKRVTNVIQ